MHENLIEIHISDCVITSLKVNHQDIPSGDPIKTDQKFNSVILSHDTAFDFQTFRVN